MKGRRCVYLAIVLLLLLLSSPLETLQVSTFPTGGRCRRRRVQSLHSEFSRVRPQDSGSDSNADSSCSPPDGQWKTKT
ncbi:unnamed protein product [Microthlaspi erraticum]|uniref:Secreted protein n=1 Tax=Microthlaspi erraticum TaxID=1685480 RepID=A0A6D2JQR2_9BRAS|nr:unnamed protein product [Microthlaspi erraticum]